MSVNHLLLCPILISLSITLPAVPIFLYPVVYMTEWEFTSRFLNQGVECFVTFRKFLNISSGVRSRPLRVVGFAGV
jgi:hypothetical protein